MSKPTSPTPVWRAGIPYARDTLRRLELQQRSYKTQMRSLKAYGIGWHPKLYWEHWRVYPTGTITTE